MKKLIEYITIIFATLTITHAAEMTTEVNRRQIYIGESVILTLSVNGFDHEVSPDMSAIKNATIEYLGSHSTSRSSMTIINGKISKDVFKGRIYRFAITPDKTGTHKIGPIYLDADGEILQADPIYVRVQGVEDQDDVIIKVTSSNSQVLIDSDFTITVDIYVKSALNIDNNVPPFNPNDPPVVTIPFIDKTEIPGLKIPDIQQILSPLLISTREAGISINDFSVRNDPFDLGSMFNYPSLSGKQRAKFRLPERLVEYKGKQYILYSLQLKYTAEELGTYTFGPVIFKGQIVVDVADELNRIALKNIFAVGSASTVEVIPPPEENRPDSYIGAIGSSMEAKASLDRQTCNVGEPLKLSIEVTGDFRKDIVFPPTLSDSTNLTSCFKVYEETAKTKNIKNGREFSWTIKPFKDGTLEIPPLELSFFNVDKGDYEVIKTPPIPVRAIKNQEADASLVIMTTTNTIKLSHTIDTEEIQLRDVQPTAITMSPDGAKAEKVAGKTPYLYTFVLAPISFIFIWLSKIIITGIIFNSKTYKKRKALNIFISSSKQAIRKARKDQKTGCSMLYKYIQEFFGNKYGKNVEGLTPSDIRMILKDNCNDTEEICGIIEKYFNAGYSSDIITFDEMKKDCRILTEKFTLLGKDCN